MKSLKFSAILVLSVSVLGMSAIAQTADNLPSGDSASSTKSQIVRHAEPLEFWVEANQLRVRDNPVAGNVVGMLERGEKVKAYQQYDNWLKITTEGDEQLWVNADFMTNTRVTWTSYRNGTRGQHNSLSIANDVKLDRIKFDGDKKAKVYAVTIAQLNDEVKLIVTKHMFKAGPYFEKRAISCSGSGQPTHYQLIGEGYNYLMMEKDERGIKFENKQSKPANTFGSANMIDSTRAIAEFACEAKS